MLYYALMVTVVGKYTLHAPQFDLPRGRRHKLTLNSNNY